MELSALRYLQAIARHQNLTRAARELRVSQPALTLAMRSLEKRFSATILIRGRTGVSLTPAGQELLLHADELFHLIERAEQRLHNLDVDEVGHFVIGCHESLGAYFLPGFMRSFHKASPRIDLTLWNGNSASVVDAVVRRDVHFGLAVNPLPHPDLVLLELCRDAMDIMVLGDGRKKRSLTMELAKDELRRGPIIYAARVPQCQELLHRLAADELVPPRMLSCGDLELCKSLALAGVGVALLPRRVAEYGHPGKLVRLHPDLPFIPDTITLIFRGDAQRTRAFLRVKDGLLKHGHSLPPIA